MREIKFRAWDTIYEMMLTSENIGGIIEGFNKRLNYEKRAYSYQKDEWYPAVDILSIFDYFQKVVENEQFIVEQYTGLKDANGVEVYEGDIVKITDLCAMETYGEGLLMKLYTRNWIVEWDKVGFKARFFDDKCGFDREIVHDLPLDNVEYEVIGNIHEGVREDAVQEQG